MFATGQNFAKDNFCRRLRFPQTIQIFAKFLSTSARLPIFVDVRGDPGKWSHPNSCKGSTVMDGGPNPSKIGPWGSLKNCFWQIINVRWRRRATIISFGGQNNQLGSNLEGPGALKTEPVPEKTDVKKQRIFCIDFGRVWMSFRQDFWWFFGCFLIISRSNKYTSPKCA